MKSRVLECGMKIVFLITAVIFIIAVLLICVFLFANGFPTIAEIGVFNFLFGDTWQPSQNKFGIAPMIVGSVYVTAGALAVGVPIGVLTAIFLARFCPKGLHRILKPAVDLLAGIPSIVYGLFGIKVIVPLLVSLFDLSSGKSILAASILLGFMILPTIVSVSETSLRAVPNHYYEGALALGATHERAVFTVVLPAAKSGVTSGVILGLGRAIGETMALIWVVGNQPVFADSILDGVRTLTGNIVLELGYATDLHREALIATGVVLFIFILIINFLITLIKSPPEHKKKKPTETAPILKTADTVTSESTDEIADTDLKKDKTVLKDPSAREG